jgi:hypothetical protein
VGDAVHVEGVETDHTGHREMVSDRRPADTGLSHRDSLITPVAAPAEAQSWSL